jgi:hypothetical protein
MYTFNPQPWLQAWRDLQLSASSHPCRGGLSPRYRCNRSHPLFTIEIAVNSLSGLPNTFTSRIEAFATEFEIEYTVLGAVEDGIDNIDAIRERALTNVRTLSDDQQNAVDDAIDRLVAKQILERDGDTIRAR